MQGVDFKWNPVFNIVIEMKRGVEAMGVDPMSIPFEDWLEILPKDKYTDIFEPLQVNQKDNLILIRYGLAEMQKGMWTDPTSIYRECRSLVIDIYLEEIVIAPFRKFFNLDEVEENSVDKIREKFATANSVYVMDKLDGSMQTARYYKGEVLLFGSMALSPEDSWRLVEGRKLLTSNYIKMLKEFPNYSFTFEYVSHINVHVVPYDSVEEGMYLLGVRDTLTGEQLHPSAVSVMADVFGVKTPRLENLTLDEILEMMKVYRSTEKEGWVINLDGHMVKVKCDDYVNIHRALDRVSSVNVVIQSIAEGTFDDLISKVPKDNRSRIMAIQGLVVRYVNRLSKEVNYWYEKAPKEDRKSFMVYVSNNVPKECQVYVRELYLGRDINYLRKGKNGYKKMRDLGYTEIELSDALRGEEINYD